MPLPTAQPKPRLRFHEKRDSAKAQAANWRKLRAAVIKRDGRTCCVCGSVRDLDMHHLLRRSLGGRDEIRNLKLLCRADHQAVHGHALRFYWKDESNRAGTCWYEWVKA